MGTENKIKKLGERTFTKENVLAGLALGILGTAAAEAYQVSPNLQSFIDYIPAALLESARWGIPTSGISKYFSTPEGRQTMLGIIRTFLFQISAYTVAAGTAQEWIHQRVSAASRRKEGKADIVLSNPTMFVYGGESSNVARLLNSTFPLGRDTGQPIGSLLFNEGIPLFPPQSGYVNLNRGKSGNDLLTDTTQIYYSQEPYAQIRQQKPSLMRTKEAATGLPLYNGKFVMIGCGESERDPLAISNEVSGSDFTPAEFLAARATAQSYFSLNDNNIVSIFVGNPNARKSVYGMENGTYDAIDLSKGITWIDPGVTLLQFITVREPHNGSEVGPLRIAYNTNNPEWVRGFPSVIDQYNAQLGRGEKRILIDMENPNVVVVSWETVTDTMSASLHVRNTIPESAMVLPLMTTPESAAEFKRFQERLPQKIRDNLVIGDLTEITTNAVMHEVHRLTE